AGGRDVVFATNSNRFASASVAADSLSVIAATKTSAGAKAVIGTIPTGRFPRELKVIVDGRTLVVTNFLSNTVEVVHLGRVAPVWSKRSPRDPLPDGPGPLPLSPGNLPPPPALLSPDRPRAPRSPPASSLRRPP